jgi:DNA-binding SARP family transcriptional activator
MDVEITLLGRFAVRVDGAPVDPAEWRRRQAATIVKILAVTPRRSLHRERLMDLIWPGSTVDEAAPKLHKAAHYARRALGGGRAVVLAGETVSLFPEQTVEVDAVRFEALAQQAAAGRDRDLAGVAADAYTGDLLPEDPYEDWAGEIRERLRAQYLDTLRLAGRWDVLAAIEPADEEAQLRVITGMARRGDRRAALRQFERLERALRQELGVAPSRAATTLRTRLLAAEAAAAGTVGQGIVGQGMVGPGRGVDAAASGIAGAGSGPNGPAGGDPAEPLLLVGGGPDRERIGLLLDRVTGGQGCALLVRGPAGIGKTALLAWLERTAAARGLRVGSGVAAQVEGAWPYAPVLEAVADLCRRHPTLLDGLADDLRSEIENGLSGKEVGWTAQGGHQRLFVAVAELVRLAAAGAGAVLVVDDAHHADDATLRLLHYLTRSTGTERVLIVLAARPDANASLSQLRQSLLGRGLLTTIDLKTLSYEEVSILLRQLRPDLGSDVVDAIWAASGGIAYTVREMAGAGGDLRQVPARDLLLTGLSAEQVGVLEAVAILGTAFDTDEYLQVCGLTEDDAYDVLEVLQRQRLLVRAGPGFEFRHTLVREEVLDSLRASRRRELHHRAAAGLAGLSRSPARIGHHLVEAGDRAAAVPWMLRAAETSAARGAYREALDTLAAVRSSAQGQELAALLSMRADFLMAAADAGALDAYREALAVVDDPAARSRLRTRLARAATAAGDLDTAAIALEGLVPDGSPDDTMLLLAQGNLALVTGDLAGAERAATEARRRVALGRPDEWQLFDLVSLQGLLAHYKGEWFARLTLELRLGAGRPALAARIFDAHLCVAEYMLYGPTPYSEVLAMAAELRETAQRSGVLRAVAFATALRGETALLMGDLDLAATELADAADLHREIGSTAGEAHTLQRLAELKIIEGDRAEANRLLHRALPLARFSSLALHLLQRLYGTMIRAAADPAAARAVVDRAEATLGSNDDCVFCSIMLAVPAARACADVGDLQDAHRHLAVAERSARMWEGTAWDAAMLELKAHLADIEGHGSEAVRLRLAAADLFDSFGQPLDARRCRATPPGTAVATRAGGSVASGLKRR